MPAMCHIWYVHCTYRAVVLLLCMAAVVSNPSVYHTALALCHVRCYDALHPLSRHMPISARQLAKPPGDDDGSRCLLGVNGKLRKVPAQQVKPEGLTHQKRHPDQWCQRSLGQRKRILPGARRIKCRSLPMLKNVILRAWYCMLCQQRCCLSCPINWP